jgi:O-antigen/teichoic acid export membrane protein
VDTTSEAALAQPVVAGGTEFGRRAKLAIAWATGLQFFRDVIQFGLMLVLVRLLPAHAYGQFGFLTTLLTFFTWYSFREFLNYTLQVRDGAVVHYQDHFTAGAVIQAAIVLLVNAVALVFRAFPDYAPVAPVLHVMSLLFVIDLPAEFRTRMLERMLDWRRLRVLQAVGFLAGAAISLGMALAGAGVWSLILPTLVVPLPFVYDLFVREGWRPTWAFSWERFQPAWKFGLARLLTLSLVAVAALAESFTLAGALGFAALGIFGRAIGLAQLLCGRLAGLLALAIYPVLTRVTPASPEFRRASGLYLRGVAWTVIPGAAMASVIADPLVRTLYGAKWLEAIPLVPWAMVGAAFAALAQTAYTVLLASGHQRACVFTDAWRTAGILGALVLALPHGPATYLAALSAVHVGALLVTTVLLWRARAIAEPVLLEALAPAVVSSVVALITAGTVRSAMPLDLHPLFEAGLVAAMFGVVYLAALRVLFRRPLAEIVAELPHATRMSRVLRLA